MAAVDAPPPIRVTGFRSVSTLLPNGAVRATLGVDVRSQGSAAGHNAGVSVTMDLDDLPDVQVLGNAGRMGVELIATGPSVEVFCSGRSVIVEGKGFGKGDRARPY